MLNNPVVEKQREADKERREKEAFRHPFVVTCVVPYIEDVKNHPSFRIVKRFCEDNQVPFSSRDYDAKRYDEDCEYIYEMPAFHLYSEHGHHYWDTFFTKDNPIQKIQDEIIRWRKEEEEKERKKQAKKDAWERKVAGLVAFFEAITFKKKPKMIVPERPKPMPSKIPLQLSDSMPKNRKGST